MAPSPECAHDTKLVWDRSLLDYNFGSRHPLAPVRVELAIELMQACGLVAVDDIAASKGSVVTPRRWPTRQLTAHHDERYVATVERLSSSTDRRDAAAHGLGHGDTPVFDGAHEAALGVCAATATAAHLVTSGQALHAFNPAGGLHHAMPSRAAGFCIYNDLAAAIDVALDHGFERVCYLDIDVHHGDGVEAMFAHDPRVMTISLHESGEHLFPGTGDVDDIGFGDAAGTVVNLPLAPATSGDVWLEVFDTVVEPIVRRFAPQIIVTQLGCDAHHDDPLAHLALTIDDFALIYQRLHRLAHDTAEGRWVATGGGGYALARVVPLAWTAAFAEMLTMTLPIDVPMPWRELVAARGLGRAPEGFLDDPVEQTAALRQTTQQFAQATIDAARRLHRLD